ncbi:hypothetical protein HII31_00059 [Pseudocercospora fuligena]|uniref:Thioredoxin reductase n=1 Tax=Pseudocercospora fuligena TaxID=685502 RepID=A0A8H6VTK2_9PEZI|nr:hypothetical protein HII31_00059 [Pseudocercospora fuligena]
MANISQEFVTVIAETLSESNVPCVLWGHCLLNVHGIPSIISSIDFVVADEQLKLSIGALATRTSDLFACSQPESCQSSSQHRCTPPPTFHMHVQDVPEVTVGIYIQSATLWFLPPLTKTLPGVHKKSATKFPFISASDSRLLPPWRPGRGSGVFTNKKGSLVMVPRAEVLLQAFMRIYARDSEKQVGSFAMAMIDYVEEYIDEDGLLDVTQLPEPFKTLYQQLKSGVMPVRQWTRALKAALDVY